MRFLPLLLLLPSLFPSSAAVPTLAYRGADFTSLTSTEKLGTTYTDTGTSTTLLGFETILANHGVNLARIRIWTAGEFDLSNGLVLATRAKAAGMKILIDLHYSDSWADPAKQAIPAAWPTDLAGLNTKIQEYTKEVVEAFISNGTPAEMVQIGNEIRAGLLFPVGAIDNNFYANASELVHSGVQGARAASSTIKTMIHLDNGWDTSTIQYWYKNMISPGKLALEDIDIMGFSFYPFFSADATFANLKTSLETVVGVYGKDVLVVETDFPVECAGGSLSEAIEAGEAGQSKWVEGIRDVLTGLPGGHGQGIAYWEPSWIGNGALGSSCSDALLVDQDGKARSSIDMFNNSM